VPIRLAVPDPEENHYGGSETESEAAYLDKDYWVQRAGEVSGYMICIRGADGGRGGGSFTAQHPFRLNYSCSQSHCSRF